MLTVLDERSLQSEQSCLKRRDVVQTVNRTQGSLAACAPIGNKSEAASVPESVVIGGRIERVFYWSESTVRYLYRNCVLGLAPFHNKQRNSQTTALPRCASYADIGFVCFTTYQCRVLMSD